MSDTQNTPNSPDVHRRNFMKTAAGAAAATTALNQTARAGAIPKDQKLKVGFVGCGGRGTSAAGQALSADDNIELYAMADVFEDRIDQSLATLDKKFEGQGKVNVASERKFIGLDGYKRVLDSDVDVVILTTTPGFRPLHLRAAVEAGKHIFAEKPMATDAAGVRHALESVEMSKSMPISLVAGFCWRYHPSRTAAYKAVMEEGIIGDVLSIYATYYSGHSKPHLEPEKRTAGMSDVEWQIMNWYNYFWLGGGGLVEQAVHSVDKIGWIMGDTPPIRCRSTGGLGAPQSGGNIFDHYHVAYEYPNNVWAHLASRKAPGCFNENADYVRGTKGTLVNGVGKDPYILDNDGNKIWRYRAEEGSEQNMYQVEHNLLFESIRSGEFINDGERMMNSTMMAIMGRMSAHTGKEIDWEEAMAAEENYFPDMDSMTMDQSYDPGPVPTPGVTSIPGIS